MLQGNSRKRFERCMRFDMHGCMLKQMRRHLPKPFCEFPCTIFFYFQKLSFKGSRKNHNTIKKILLGSGRSQSNKTKPMVHKLGVTLEELYNGKVGHIVYLYGVLQSRSIMVEDDKMLL